MEKLLHESDRLYEEHRKAIREYHELKIQLQALIDKNRKGS
jgi:hypothetical protein